MFLQHQPIQRKLMTMIMGTSAVVLGLTCAAFLGYEFFTFRRSSIRQLSSLADVIATESTAAVAFDNQDDGTEVLAALGADQRIVAAGIYDHQGRLFAHYPASKPESAFPRQPRADGYGFISDHLVVFTPIIQTKGQERLGTLYLDSTMAAMYERLRLYGIIAAAIAAASTLVAYLLSRTLQRQISGPVLALAETARAVSERRDYSVRARKLGDGELALLTETFNQMLAQIQAQNAELEKRVYERTAELEAANDELQAFCVSAAHDLRTPLRAISGFAELALEQKAPDQLNPELRRYMELIFKGADEMSKLINDLLAFSRLGRQALSRRDVDLQRLCQEVFASLEEERKNRRIDFHLYPLPSVYGDPALLRVVVFNLIANALKYTRPRETAIVEIGVHENHGDAGAVYFVRDNGVGFDMRHAAKLFGVFQRLHLAHEFEGTGVGLATARRIVERHGGRIWAEAAPDGGATFFFTVPSERELERLSQLSARARDSSKNEADS